MRFSNAPSTLGVASIAAACVLGCGGSDSGGSDLDAMAEMLDQKVETNAQEAQAKSLEEQKAEAQALREAAEALAAEPPSEVTIHDMVRGSALEGGGYLSTTLRGGIAAEQKLGLYTAEHATNIFYGLEGHFPESHEEYMEKVIEFNQIKLDELKEPYEYIYVPETHKLMKRPSPEAIEAAQAKADAAEAALPAE